MNTNYSTRVKAPTNTQPEVNVCSRNFTREDEDLFSNLQGRSKTDGNNNKVKNKVNNLMNCKTEILVSTMNLRTLREQHKRKELAYLFKSRDVNI